MPCHQLCAQPKSAHEACRHRQLLAALEEDAKRRRRDKALGRSTLLSALFILGLSHSPR